MDETNAALFAAREDAAQAREELTAMRAEAADAARRERLAKLLGFSSDGPRHLATHANLPIDTSKGDVSAVQATVKAAGDDGAVDLAAERSSALAPPDSSDMEAAFSSSQRQQPSVQDLSEVTKLLG